MKKVSDIMLSLLASEVCSAPFPEGIEKEFNDKILAALFKISKLHDMAHIVSYALEKKGILPEGEIAEQFKNEHLMAFFRCQKQVFELERICCALEEAKIKHIPLKGSVLREFYPENWLRTSCDIDILVEKSEIKRAAEVLKKKIGAKYDGESRHDIAFYTDNKIKLELHYGLVADNRNYKFEEELLKVWDYVKPYKDWKYRYLLTDEMFYLYHIAHIAIHFKEGGCGVKPLLDLFLMERNMSFDEEKRQELLTNSGLLKCSEAIKSLSEVWFGGKEPTEQAEKMADYILIGGVYGSVANRIILQNELEVGKGRYLLSRIFLPYERLKYQYPVLQKYKWLYPLFIVVRWTRLIFVKGNSKRQLTELKYVSSIGNTVADEMQTMLKEMDI